MKLYEEYTTVDGLVSPCYRVIKDLDGVKYAVNLKDPQTMLRALRMDYALEEYCSLKRRGNLHGFCDLQNEMLADYEEHNPDYVFTPNWYVLSMIEILRIEEDGNITDVTKDFL